MMGRLTGYENIAGHCHNIPLVDIQLVFDRLAAYEDTGLTPEQVKAQQWISVKDRLPDKNQYVLGYFPAMSGTPSSMQITVGWNMNERSAIGGWGAAYWMPLPEPPKEAQK